MSIAFRNDSTWHNNHGATVFILGSLVIPICRRNHGLEKRQMITLLLPQVRGDQGELCSLSLRLVCLPFPLPRTAEFTQTQA